MKKEDSRNNMRITGETVIIVHREFGDEDFMDIYAEYLLSKYKTKIRGIFNNECSNISKNGQ